MNGERAQSAAWPRNVSHVPMASGSFRLRWLQASRSATGPPINRNLALDARQQGPPERLLRGRIPVDAKQRDGELLPYRNVERGDSRATAGACPSTGTANPSSSPGRNTLPNEYGIGSWSQPK